MANLELRIGEAVSDFAREIVAAVRESTLQELLAMQGVAPAAPGRKRGRPPKAKPGQKPGRPAKASTKKARGKAAKATAKKRAKIAWPKCKHPGCEKNAWRRGKGYCGEHAKKAGKTRKAKKP